VLWTIVVKKKPKVGYSFFGAFRSYRLPKVKEDINVHFAIRSNSSPCKMYQRIPGTLWSYETNDVFSFWM